MLPAYFNALPFAVTVALGVAAIAFLLGLYQRQPGVLGRVSQRWCARWAFSPTALGAFSWGRLALVSALGLFLEMLMIRWVSSEVTIFAYFKNFVLIACFLGFGLGCYFCRRTINLVALVLPTMLLTAVLMVPWPALRNLMLNLPLLLGATAEVQVWGVPTMPLAREWMTITAAVVLVIPFFALVTFVFIPVGQMVGWYLEQANGIAGYTVNVLASLAGIALYTVLCFLYQPPAVWFALAGLMLVLLLWRSARLRLAAAVCMLACVAFLLIPPPRPAQVFWSPYQKLTLTPQTDGGEITSYELNTNGSWYQHMVDLSPAFVAQHPERFKSLPAEWDPYNVPYHVYPRPASVLVLGAGTGNDVAAALRNGASRVVAVEIDPLILRLGRRLHFERPYDSPRVEQVLDDARSYIQNSPERFDLIVFSLLDSHTTSSHFSNIRIDNYVYTEEALRAARKLLRPDGVFIVKFAVRTPWIADRLHGLMESAFHAPPLDISVIVPGDFGAGRFFVAGSPERVRAAAADGALRAHTATPLFDYKPVTLTTDDWPYFYQHEPGLPMNIILISVLLVGLCWGFLRTTGAALSSVRWHFFFLGAGFMLLEAQIISKMALLFGTTWLVNSFVVGGLLLLIVAANLLVARRRQIPFVVAYAGIFAAMALAWFVPMGRLFFQSLWVKAVVATVVLCLPVFFAGIVFIRSFAAAGFSGEALGSNLFGSLVGGLLESLSFWTGLKSLLLLAAVLYIASWIAVGRGASRSAARAAGA